MRPLDGGAAMLVDRRRVLAGAASLAAPPCLAAEPPKAPEPLARYERETGGHIGLYAESLRTGRRLAWRADERFVMCSTFKASLAALVLSRVDRGREQLGRMVPFGAADLLAYAPAARASLARGAMSVGEMCRAAVELSDNTCANLLLAQVGGPAALTRFWRAIGDRASRLDHNEPELNRTPLDQAADTTTPAAMAATLRRLVFGEVLAAASRRRLTEWMVNCRTGEDRLRGGLPKAWRIGDKTGNNGADAAGDIAFAWPPGTGPLIICAYTRGGAPTPEQLQSVFAAAARAAARMLA